MDLKALGPTLDMMSADALLAKVVRHNAEMMSSAPDDMVETRLVLASGVELIGKPIDIDNAKNTIVATDAGLGYTNVSTLAVLEVLNPLAAQSLIAEPALVVPTVPAKSPSRSELRDVLAELNARLQQRYTLTVEAEVLDDSTFGDAGKNQFVAFLEMLEKAIDEIGSEDVGEITIASLGQIVIAKAPGELAVKRSGEILLIAVPFDEPFPKTLSARLDTELQLNL